MFWENKRPLELRSLEEKKDDVLILRLYLFHTSVSLRGTRRGQAHFHKIFFKKRKSSSQHASTSRYSFESFERLVGIVKEMLSSPSLTRRNMMFFLQMEVL